MPNETNNPEDGLKHNQNNPATLVVLRCQVRGRLKSPARKIKIRKSANRPATRAADSIRAVKAVSADFPWKGPMALPGVI